jgi:hypothetical protein
MHVFSGSVSMRYSEGRRRATVASMSVRSPSADDIAPTPAAEVHDEQGVDRSQIRAYLELTPRERLQRASDLAAYFRELQELNGVPRIR